MLEYYFVLRSVLKANPCLRSCLTRCRHCRIFFLTHPRNAGRSDLRCSFGCQDAHRKQRSIQRSVAYYSTREGKIKKQIQNCKRGSGATTQLKVCNSREEGEPDLALDEYRFDAGMVDYVRMVTSLIEERRVSRDEILRMLARAMRQHSMVRNRRIDYVLQYLKHHAP